MWVCRLCSYWLCLKYSFNMEITVAPGWIVRPAIIIRSSTSVFATSTLSLTQEGRLLFLKVAQTTLLNRESTNNLRVPQLRIVVLINVLRVVCEFFFAFSLTRSFWYVVSWCEFHVINSRQFLGILLAHFPPHLAIISGLNGLPAYWNSESFPLCVSPDHWICIWRKIELITQFEKPIGFVNWIRIMYIFIDFECY